MTVDFDEPGASPANSFQPLIAAFRDQLLACLQECAQGRRGLFSEDVRRADGDQGWPEAGRLRQLAAALQSILAQEGEHDPLCDEFLDLCTIHGESHPGESRLARAFLNRIDSGEVGTPTQKEQRPWSS